MPSTMRIWQRIGYISREPTPYGLGALRTSYFINSRMLSLICPFCGVFGAMFWGCKLFHAQTRCKSSIESTFSVVQRSDLQCLSPWKVIIKYPRHITPGRRKRMLWYFRGRRHCHFRSGSSVMLGLLGGHNLRRWSKRKCSCRLCIFQFSHYLTFFCSFPTSKCSVF